MAQKLGAQKLTPKATVQKLSLAVGDFQTPANRLAASLNEFSSNVVGITVRKSQEHAAGQEAKGRTAAAEAIAAGHDTIEEMVKAGVIDKGMDPFFRDGVLFMAGKARADAYNNALAFAAAEEIPADSTDPHALDSILERVASEFIGDEEDEAIQAGFASRAEGFATAAVSRHVQRVADNIVDLNLRQVGDLFRGVALEAIDGVDAQFHVPNLVLAMQAQAEEWLENNPDASSFEKRTMNRGIVTALGSLVDDQSLNEDNVIAIMKLLKGGTGSLWGVQEHAEYIQEAIDTSVGRETRRAKLTEDRILRQKMANEEEAMAGIFATAGETGILDMQPIVAQQRASFGKAFRTGFVVSSENLAINWESAAQDTYVGSAEIERDYVQRIYAGENVSLEELSGRIVTRELTGDQVIKIGNLVLSHKNMLANNPQKAARFRRMDSAVKGAMSSFMGSEFGSQSYYAAVADMASALEGWESDPKNANFSATAPEFLGFVNETLKRLQDLYMEPGQKEFLQETQAGIEAENRLLLYGTQLYETSVPTLKRWYAETIMMAGGRPPSDDLADFLTADGRAIGVGDEPLLQAETYADAIFGQLVQAGASINDEELDSLMAEIRGVAPEADVDDEAEEDTDLSAVSINQAEGIFFDPTFDGKAPGPLVVATRLYRRFLESIPATSVRTDLGKIPEASQIFRDALVARGWVPDALPEPVDDGAPLTNAERARLAGEELDRLAARPRDPNSPINRTAKQ